jgi:hypothetical protein
MNCQAACKKCNWLGQGEDVKFREGLIAKYGQREYDLLITRKYTSKKWTKFELEYLIKYYSEQVKELLKQKTVNSK